MSSKRTSEEKEVSEVVERAECVPEEEEEEEEEEGFKCVVRGVASPKMEECEVVCLSAGAVGAVVVVSIGCCSPVASAASVAVLDVVWASVVLFFNFNRK